MILEDGYAWNGCVYRSLSQVANAITGTNWNGHRFFGLKAVRNGDSSRKRSAAPIPNSFLDTGMSSALATLGPGRTDRSSPLAMKESGSASPIESALPPSCEGRPKIRQIGPRKDPRSDPSEVPRQARAIREVGR